MSDQSSNPFAPKGLRQAAAASEGNAFAPTGQGDTSTPDNPFAPRSWYTGANMEGTENGYNTPFFEKFFAQQTEAEKEGKLAQFFTRPGATGIVTYDHGAGDGGPARFKFGDVYEDGKKIANVYDTYDRQTADLLMADLTLDADTKAKTFKQVASDPDAVSTVVQDKRRKTESEVGKWLTQQDFQDDVNAQHEAWDTTTGKTTTVLAGAAGAAAVGAGIGSIVPGIGTALGAGIGFVTGGIGAWLNQDELINQAARAKVQQDMASEQFGDKAGFTAGLQGWGGLAMKAISPASNLTHGLYDVASGTVGDRAAAWYDVDETGQRKRNGVLQAVDVGASLIDAAGQFGSGTGVLLFQGAMGASIVGQVGTLTTTGGYTFDDRAGNYDLITRNDAGEFDLGSLSAGIGSIGIDVVQLGMARGIVQASATTARTAAAATGQAPAAAGIVARLEGAAGSRVHAGGFSFKLDDAGRAIDGSRRISLSVLAPSEAIQGLSASMRARRIAASQSGGAVTADSFYRAATELATGSRAWNAALVNGFGESSEEVAQAILEPLSHNDTASMEEIINAGLMGFSMGVGMTLGASSRGATADQRLYAQAYITRGALGQGELTKSEWSAMSQQQKQAATAAPPYVAELARTAAKQVADTQRATAVSNHAALEKYVDAAQAMMEREAGRITSRTDGAFVITQLQDAGRTDEAGNVLPGSMPSHAVGSSFTTLRLNFGRRMDGISIQLASLALDDPMHAVLTRTLAEGQQMLDYLTQAQAQIDGALAGGSATAVRQVVEEANDTLARWFDGDGADDVQIDARRRAVSQLFIRDPQDQAGSYQLLLPQASFELTRTNSNNALQVSHAILQAIGGDYDGDKIREQAQVILDPAKFANLRTGMNLLGAMGSDGGAVNIMTRPYETYEITVMSRAMAADGPLKHEAEGILARIRTALETRYAESAIPASDLSRVLDRFVRDVRDNDGKARARLLDSLATYGEEMTEFARSRMTNEWLWVDQVVQSNLQRFQRINATHTVAPGELNTTRRPPIAQTTDFRAVAAGYAATDAITLGLRAAGSSLFRMFQKLHYSTWNATVEGTQRGNDEALVELTALYEELSQGMTQTALDALDAVDEITGRVQFKLRKLAADARAVATETGQQLEASGALAITANMAMPWVDDAGTLHTGTTTAQALLAREVIRFEAEHAASMTPELSSKINRYKRLTRPGQGEQAFVEVLGAVQLYELMGPAATALGSNLTVEQYVRQYVNQSEAAKQDTARLLRTEPEYLGREAKENIPYQLQETAEQQISGYRSVVDSIVGAGNKRLSIDANGHAIGEIGERSDQYLGDLVEGFTKVQAAILNIEGYRKGLNRKDPAAAEQWLADFMDANPGWAKAVMGLIPDSMVNAAMTVVTQGGQAQLKLSPWIYQVLLLPPQEAAMHYWRAITMAQWNALGGSSTAGSEADKVRAYGRLESRFQQLLYRTAQANDGGIRITRLMSRMYEAKDLKSFFQFVNAEMRGDEAPYTPWVDDVSELASDRTGGGLTAAMPGALVRESILEFKDHSIRLVASVQEEREIAIADERTMVALSRAIADGDNAAEGDKALLGRAREVLEFVKQQRTTLGPGAMRAQTAGSLLQFFARAHTKGVSPWPYVPIGSFEALGDSFGYETPFGQHEAATVGTQDPEDIGANMPMLARDAVESMTADGTPIVWDQFSIEHLVETWRNKPEAIPAIRAILFPSVHERTQNDKVSQQFLTGKSITELFERSTYERLLTPTKKDRAIYLSMIESRAKNFGGNYPVMRLANDLVLARTSALKQGLTPAEAERMTQDAYDQIAQVLQVVGELAALDPTVRNTALSDLKAKLSERIRVRQAGALVGLRGQDADVLTKLTYEQLVEAKRTELLDAVAAAPNEAAEAALLDDFDQLTKRIELVLDSTPFQRVAATYAIPWKTESAVAAKQREVVEYVRSHPNLGQRASWAKTEVSLITNWLIDDNRLGDLPALEQGEWDVVSRAIVGTYLDEATAITAAGVSTPVYADAKKESQLRYWDPAYSYLLDDLLDPGSPMVRAAAELHTASGRRGVRNATGSLVDKILTNIYPDFSLGPWTADIARLSAEANSRLDAAAAGEAIGMAGSSPRRQATESAATRRTFELPPEEAFALGEIPMDVLYGNQSTGVVTTQLRGAPRAMALMRMNGRFARGATLQYTDAEGQAQTVDLWAGRPVLGRTHVQDAGAAASGLRSLTVNQLRNAVGRALPDGATGASVVVDFVHPDAQPATGYAHNLFFEGTSFELDADSQESLNATLWFAPGSVSPNEQAKALQANKSGKPALEVTDVQSSQDRAAAEQNWDTDFAGMLTRKTMYLMTTDLGSGRFQPAFFNAVFKRMKTRHFVRGLLDGTPVLWTAEQVIEFQLANPGVPLPLEKAELWKPSPRVLRTMLGEHDAEGTLLAPDGLPQLDISKVEVWDGTVDKLLAKVPGALAVDPDTGAWTTADLLDTPAAQRSFQSQLTIQDPMTDERRTAYSHALRTADARRDEVRAARASEPGFGSRMKDWAGAVASNTIRSFGVTSTGLDARAAGLPFIGPRNIADTEISSALFQEMGEVLQLDGLRAAWVFKFGKSDKSGPVAGVFNEVSLPRAVAGKGPRHLWLAQDDIVVLDLESAEATYGGVTDKTVSAAETALVEMIKARATIAIPDSVTGGDLRHYLGQFLRENNYTAVAGSKHLFRPVKEGGFATPNARLTSLTETHAVSAQSTVAVFHARDLPIAENAAWVLNPGQHHPVSVVVDLVPVNLFSRFNVPVESLQVQAVQATLSNLDDATRALLYDSMGVEAGSPEAADFDAALRRLVDAWDADPTNPRVTPRRGADFGTGDIIPLLDAKTGDILLYRHGHELPRTEDVRAQLLKSVVDGEQRAGIAVASTKVNAAHTTRRGQVVEFQPRSQYGLSAMLRVPLQEYADKLQLEGSGIKLVTTPMGQGVQMPSNGLFENWPLDLAMQWDDTVSKEGFLGLVDNFRNAIAYFGADFRPELVKTLFGKDLESMSATDRVATLGQLNDILLAVQRGRKISVPEAHDLLKMAAPGAQLTELLGPFSSGELAAGWSDAVADSAADPAALITRSVLLYLMTPQAQVEHVLESGGFNAPGARTGDGKSIMMPQLFTNVFDNAALDSPLREHMITKINDQIYNPTAEEGYYLAKDFTFHVTSSTGTYSGWLQFSEVHSSGDNPVTNEMAFDRSTDQKVSAHSVDIAFQAIGGRTAIPAELDKTRAWVEGAGIERYETEGALWEMLRAVPADDSTFKPWRALTPAEIEYKALARDAVAAFRQELSREGWTETEEAKYLALRTEAAEAYGLTAQQSGIVDFWIRQMLGQPLGEGDQGRISALAATETLELEILWNAQNGYLPVHGAEVPQLHFNDLAVLHRAAEAGGPFKLKETIGGSTYASSWDDWVHIGLAVGETETDVFDPMFRLSTDGFLHSFLDASETLVGLPVSRSRLQQESLFDPETSKMVLSIDPNQNVILGEVAMLDPARASLAALMGGQRMAGGKVSLKDVPASVRARRTATRRRWRKENNVPQVVPMTMRNMRETGAQFIDEGTTSNALMRILVNLRVGNALFNPFLWASAILETGVRGTLEDATNLLMGDSTGKLAQLGTAVGITPRYSPAQMKKFRQLTQTLGQRTEFKGMVYRSLVFQQDKLSNAGRIERWTHNFARFGSTIQDPTYGMRGDTLARRYLEAVLSYMASTPMDTAISPDYLVAQLATDPTWVQKNMPEAHTAATAVIANVRSLKATPMSLALRGIYEPLSQNPNMLFSMPSTLFLKLPLMFSGYGMNVLTTLLGLQGLSSATAMYLEGRNKGLIGKIQARMAGKEYNETTDGTFDMSEVLEGVDLSKAFIQAGVTHTSLFAFGMLAGGLGLSGESEEDKRRRRAATYQGAGYVYDPRKIENDFRNADAVFLDWLPFGLDSMFRVTTADSPSGQKSMANLHWTMKQFISPLIGMEKFFETGDARQIVWGFEEAINSFPLINSAGWSDAVETFAELQSAATDHEQLGTPEGLSTSFDFMLKGFWTMERMLFENSFINMLYVGTDKYDRDPWVLPERDSEGNIVRDRLDVPRPSKALQDFVDPETGEVTSGYVGRDWWEAQLHGFAENRATLALMSSLFTGFGDSTYLRNNMAVKTRTLKKPELTQEQAEGLILSEWDNADRVVITEVNGQQFVEGGAEILTEDGARAVFQGVWKKAVNFGDPALEGVFIPFEMRNEIQKKWMAELVQEGVDAGLTEAKAKSRMYNIWYGPSTDPTAIGLKDVLWSDQVSYARDLRYNQLNTTYVMGPDGRPWATGATRDSLMNAFGMMPLNRFYVGDVGNLGVDSRLNSVDAAAGINTGMRALERVDESWYVPTPEEVGEAIEKALTKALADTYGNNSGNNGNGWQNYGRGGGYSRRSSGYSGGGGSYTKLNAPQDSYVPYDNSIPFINTSTPIIRRASIRRERFDSDRGRLNQWQ